MSAKAEISYYCDDCGKGCCDDNRVLCSSCMSEYESKVDELQGLLDEARDEISGLKAEIEQIQEPTP